MDPYQKMIPLEVMDYYYGEEADFEALVAITSDSYTDDYIDMKASHLI